MEDEKKSNKSIIIIVVIVIVIGGAVGVYFALKGGKEVSNSNVTTNTVTTNTTTNANTAVDPYADLMKYDGKIWKVVSTDGKVDGRVGIKIDKTWDYPIHVAYFYKVNDEFPQVTPPSELNLGASYYYIASNVKSEEAGTEGSGTGAFSTIFCNKETMVDVLDLTTSLSDPTEVYLDCEERLDPYHTTSTFYHTYNKWYNNETFNIDEVLENNLLEVYNTAPFYKEEPETGGWGADDSEVIAGNSPVATYNLTFSEL